MPHTPADSLAAALVLDREREVEWLANELGRAISNLGYPVGMGLRPSDTALQIAANKLFDRYAGMIALAPAAQPEPITEATKP